MKFKTIQEAFNHYMNSTAQEIETRAAAIKQEISTDPNADIDALNIELGGLAEAKKNIEERSQNPGAGMSFNPITGMSFNSAPLIRADEDIFASREYRSAFHKTMLRQPLNTDDTAVMQRANHFMATEYRASFIDSSEAQAVIPTQMLNEIYKLATDMGGVLPHVRRFDIPANVAVPVAEPEAMAEWHAEGEEVAADNKKPTNVMFNGYELMKVFSISAKASRMSITAFESYLQQELARTMISALEYAVLFGTGVNQPLGLLADDVVKNELSILAEYSGYATALSKVKRGYNAGSAWAMNNTTLYSDVIATMDAIGRPIFTEAREGNVDRILGKPIIMDDFIPDGVILLGNFQYYAMNYPQTIMLEVSRDSSFRKGLIDYRALAIADGQPVIPDAFMKLYTSSYEDK